MTPKKCKSIVDPEGLFIQSEKHEEQGNIREAFKCLLAAAQTGHTSSQINLGNFYSDGKGVRKDPDEAARWYREAYKNGDRVGALNLAIDLRTQGKTKSAVIWFKKAIAMRDGDAYLALAKIYIARRRGKKAAANLLKQALLLGRSDISDDDKEEAQVLLREISTTD